jgi:glycosyltransferase involved in cell wall biosynthesis
VLVSHLRSQEVEVEILSLPWRKYAAHLLDNFKASLYDDLNRLEVDVLIQDELNHPSLFRVNWKVRRSYHLISLVHHLRCDELRPTWQNHFYRQVERRYLDSVDGFIFNSHTTRRAVDHISKIGDRPWIVATPGGDRLNPQLSEDEIRKLAHQTGELRLVFLGNLIPRKGLHTVVDALVPLPKDAFILDVVGPTDVDSGYMKAIEKQIEQNRLSPAIRFHGPLDDDKLAEILRAAHVMVVPSSYEGFGIVYLEGMGFGLPAIGSKRGSASEIITSGENGFLIDPDDLTGLSGLLKTLHEDRQYLGEISLAAHQQYRRFPGWEQSMAGILAFLQELVRC